MYGISSALIITGLAASELASAVRPSRLAGVLGALSYPLYLTHGMTISAVVGLSEKMHYAGPDWFLLFFAVALSCMAAMLVNRFVEIPVARYLKGLRSRRQRTASSNEAMTASELPTRQ